MNLKKSVLFAGIGSVLMMSNAYSAAVPAFTNGTTSYYYDDSTSTFEYGDNQYNYDTFTTSASPGTDLLKAGGVFDKSDKKLEAAFIVDVAKLNGDIADVTSYSQVTTGSAGYSTTGGVSSITLPTLSEGGSYGEGYFLLKFNKNTEYINYVFKNISTFGVLSWLQDISVKTDAKNFIGLSHYGLVPSVECTDDPSCKKEPNDISEVPVPAAVWLFGSALFGLMGVSRKKKAILA